MSRATRHRVRLIHWNADEAKERAARLRAAGYEVDSRPVPDGKFRDLRRNPPDAVVIDLSRLPAQGRDIGIAIRHYEATRRIPLVLVDGDPRKVPRILQQLPNAIHTPWRRVRSALRRAITQPPPAPPRARSVFDGYAGRPLVEKLGIKEGSVVMAIGAPDNIEDLLDPLPPGVVIRQQARGRCDVALWFVTNRAQVARRVARLGALPREGGLWIVWPKKTSGMRTDLSQATVREIGLAAGLVDYKVAAIDVTWTGLRFTRRKGRAPKVT